ncbi:MAG: 3-phosphoglycerate dehydrogenase [Candidatus Zophobacter franzmannii]|nr:3-phosphoglycerate dehydrogenase [Candidatus Zophobacter franzmannii]
MKKVLVATEKPFSKDAVIAIGEECKKAGYELVLLEKYTDKADLLKAVKDVDALIIRSDKVTPEVIDHADNLKIVVRGGAGYDNVDLPASNAKGIVVMNTPGQNSNAVAELAFGMMLSMARNKFNPKAGTELRCKTIGIHAYGNIGRLIAEIGKGFGMEVYAYDPFVCNCKMEEDNVKPLDSAKDLYAKCQYISLHLPVNEQTKDSINYDLLNSMPKNAVLVNTARKEVVNEADLLKIMADRPDFKYISDIAPKCREELEANYADRVFFTPKKMGAQTGEANFNAGMAAIKQIIGYFEKGDTTCQVNK